MTSIIKAVKESDIKAIEQCLAEGASPDTVDEEQGQSLLAIAAWNGNVEVVKTLLEHEADPNFLGTVEWPLETAAGKGYTEIVELLLDYDAEVEVADEDGGTPLISAAAGGHLEIVELLIEAGADAKYKSSDQKRAIIYAAEKGHKEIVAFLAPLSTAGDRKQCDLLLQLAAQGPLSESAKQFLDAAYRGKIEIIQEYVASGGDVNVMEKGSLTALMWAANRDNINMVKLLVAHGANVNQMDSNGNYALLFAFTKGECESYQFLYPLTEERLQKDLVKQVALAKKMARERGYIVE